MIVNENIEFKQGGNPYKSLKIGQAFKLPKIGDKFIMLVNLAWDWDIEEWYEEVRLNAHNNIDIDEEFYIKSIKNNEIDIVFNSETPQDFDLDFFINKMNIYWKRL